MTDMIGLSLMLAEPFKALCFPYILLESSFMKMAIHYIYVYALLQVYSGLQNLLEKPVLVGEDNLTWTLVKYVNSDSCSVGSAENDLVAESYSKLSVALSVMHECFEPLPNPFSSGDIVEDVIFNQRSDILILQFMFITFN